MPRVGDRPPLFCSCPSCTGELRLQDLRAALELVFRLGRQSGATVDGRITQGLEVEFTITFPSGGSVTKGGTHGSEEEARQGHHGEAGKGGAQAGRRKDE